MDIETIMERSRVQLLLAEPFFATLLMNVPIKVSPKGEDSYLIDTMGTDGKTIYFSPDFVQKIISEAKDGSQNGTNVKPVIGVLIHEVMHVALGHLWRREHRIPKLWNAACDYAINDLIIQVDKAELPKGNLYDPKYHNMCEEEIYHKLRDKINWQECTGNCSTCGMDGGSGSGGDEEGEGEGEGSDSGSGDGQEKEGKGKGGSGGQKQCPCQEQGWGDHSQWDDHKKDHPEMEGKSKQLLAQAAQVAKMQGKLPAYLDRLVEELLDPQIDWRTALASFIQPSKVDYSFNPNDRRFTDFIIPEINGESVEELVIAIDTSGSIGQNELTVFLSECYDMLKLWPTLQGYIVPCDAEVHGWHNFDDNYNFDTALGGGGGTSFCPVFDEIVERRITPCAVIYFTDMYGSFPDQDPGYPVLWLAIDNKETEAPFGITLHIDSEDLRSR